jgi:uncharacterized protein (DUF1778 family)
MNKDIQINIRISKEEKKALEEDAQKEARSVSNFLLWCWKQWRQSKRSK